MNPSTNGLKSRYRNLCTEVKETHDKNGRVISKTRRRREGEPSLKEWASRTEAGKAWRTRKRNA